MSEQQRWDDVVRIAEATSPRTAEVEYYHGVALAKLGRFADAEARLTAGLRLASKDERFPIELGGLAFKQKRFSEATRWLRRAVRLNSGDPYANDFLGTLFYLQGNLEAALKYWNRAGKPALSNVRIQPGLRTDPVLLDRAFTFAPGSTLLVRDLRTTSARLKGLGVFGHEQLRLDGRQDGTFDAQFTARERNGPGDGWSALLSVLRGVPYQAVQPEYFNIAGRAVNFESMARWDPDKRRLQASFSAPLRLDSQFRFQVAADARDERWEIRQGAASLGSFGLRRTAVGAGITSFRSGEWRWSSAAELSHRDFDNIAGDVSSDGPLSLTGYQLKHTLNVGRTAWRSPENRIETSVTVTSDTGKIWSQSPELFERHQLTANGRWLPRRTGDDYAVRAKLGAGTTFGQVPFDELFILGMERDNDLWMRGHVGTNEGRKGNAPMGRGYMLWNSEVDKILYRDGLLRITFSPFLDIGKITSGYSASGSRQWLWDTGVQAKVSVLGVGFTFTYGKDLRSGNNIFYFTAQR